MKAIKLFLLLFLNSLYLFSQNEKDIEFIKSKNNLEEIKNLQEISLKRNQENKLNVSKWLKKNKNKRKKEIKSDSTTIELIRIENGNPIYYTTHNFDAGVTTRTNKLYSGGGLGLNLTGQNMNIGIWDAGSSRSTHNIFTNRVTVKDGSASDWHATHVGGTMIGTNNILSVRGMAYQANLLSYDWNSDYTEILNEISTNSLLISNHSYGYSPNGLALFYFGKYNDDAQFLDQISNSAPYYLYVSAAGNSRNNANNYNPTKNGYDLITGRNVSKNNLVVGAVQEVLNYTGPNSVVMSNFSSWGGTDDGRIKPDLVAKGVAVTSAHNASNSSYSTTNGTSMAAPNVSGSLLLLQQLYHLKNNKYMLSATLRALVLHTADECGTSNGPDYAFGYGLLNCEKAATLILKDLSKTNAIIEEKQLTQGSIRTFEVDALGSEPLVVSLGWNDPAAQLTNELVEDSPESKLVNDLDIKVTQLTNEFFPWKLDRLNVTNAATNNSQNDIDNFERIDIPSPSGRYKIQITHKGTLVNSLQNYSLVITGISKVIKSEVMINPTQSCN